MKGCGTSKLVCGLVVIGAINWGLIGLGGFFGGDWNVVHMLLGFMPWLEWVVYILVGIAGVMKMFGCKCKMCKDGANCSGGNMPAGH